MIVPGSVKAGDELVYEFGDTSACNKIVKVSRICRDGVIVLESGTIFRPDGLAFSERNSQFESDEFHPFTPELHLLIPEIRKEIEQKGYQS